VDPALQLSQIIGFLLNLIVTVQSYYLLLLQQELPFGVEIALRTK